LKKSKEYYIALDIITGYNKYRKVDGIIECCCFSGLEAFELAC
jgi:hypothetical protein